MNTDDNIIMLIFLNALIRNIIINNEDNVAQLINYLYPFML